MVNFEKYMDLRKIWPANQALRALKTYTQFDNLEFDNAVRFKVELDECYDYDTLAGDCFNPEVNTDINPLKLKREENLFCERIRNAGVWGIVSEYFDGEQWQHSDSVWGFVGDDWQNSGYDSDVKQSAIDAYNAIEKCECCGRPKVKGLPS